MKIEVVTFDVWQTLLGDTLASSAAARALRLAGVREALAGAGHLYEAAALETADGRALTALGPPPPARCRGRAGRLPRPLVLGQGRRPEAGGVDLPAHARRGRLPAGRGPPRRRRRGQRRGEGLRRGEMHALHYVPEGRPAPAAADGVLRHLADLPGLLARLI